MFFIGQGLLHDLITKVIPHKSISRSHPVSKLEKSQSCEVNFARFDSPGAAFIRIFIF